MKKIRLTSFTLGIISFLFIGYALASSQPEMLKSWAHSKENASKWVYPTNGVHSDFGCNESNNNCIAKRSASDPSDPQFPNQWVSNWTMFRVMTNYDKNPPPYTNPPATLMPSDYTVSYGTTYYDANYVPDDKDGTGAMMEHYDKYCLPIFPRANNSYTCSFVSLGNKAYFLTYDDRPKDMPQCCQFSPLNHPPRQDFIKHLDYSSKRSENLNGSIQAYEWKAMLAQGGPLFGYSFNKEASPDTYTSVWYRHPQSFFFSGDDTKANAPIVSQNYTSFRAEQPKTKSTWDQVAKMCPKTNVPKCHLFPGQ